MASALFPGFFSSNKTVILLFTYPNWRWCNISTYKYRHPQCKNYYSVHLLHCSINDILSPKLWPVMLSANDPRCYKCRIGLAGMPGLNKAATARYFMPVVMIRGLPYSNSKHIQYTHLIKKINLLLYRLPFLPFLFYINEGCVGSKTHVQLRVVVPEGVSRPGTNDYIPQTLLGVITCPCPWCFWHDTPALISATHR